MRPKL